MSHIPIFSYQKYIHDKQQLRQTGTVDASIQKNAPRSPGSRGLKKTDAFTKEPVHMMGEETDPGQRPSPTNPSPSVHEGSLDVPTPTIPEIAKKHGVDVQQILDQLRKGLRVESEHTTDFNTALEIALDHLNELPDYYDRLAQAEKPVAEGDLVAKRQSFYDILANKIREPQTGMRRPEYDPRILARVWQMLTGEKVEYDPGHDTFTVHKATPESVFEGWLERRIPEQYHSVARKWFESHRGKLKK